MDSDRALLGLQVLQRSLPASTGTPSQTVDWLPSYFGYSWVAYASHSSLVISITPSPTSKHEGESGLCQVIDSPHDAPTSISCVRWAPSSIGLLGASGEQFIWIYKPQFSNPHEECTSPDFPQGWVSTCKLEHSFQVRSFAWTESGDGLLSIGTEVIMWKQVASGWCCLWTSSVVNPQAFSAATWSANGLAATAEGHFGPKVQADECEKIVTNGKATVWWWEESLGIFQSELVHPQEIVFLQWRPSEGPFLVNEDFRPVLLTACKDGVVRLWLEIDSGRARLDKALGKDVPAKYLKPAYFVSAVIEAEQCLRGVLGVDVFVSWPLGSKRVTSKSVSACSNVTVTKRQNSGSCEWLVGLGSNGTIFLWSIFCLDDIYPPRCPRVFLWKQASGVISVSVRPPETKSRQIILKIVSQRLGGRCTDPPSTLDFFYTSQPALFHWTRIWPPISSLCGDFPSKLELPQVAVDAAVASKAKKDVWGMTSENISLNGHADDIIDVAVHPTSFLGLVATLDSQGHIFLWRSSFFLSRNSSLLHSIWSSSDQLLVFSDSNVLTWLPAVFSGGKTVLLVARTGFVDCYLIPEIQKLSFCAQPLAVKRLCILKLVLHSLEQFSAIWSLPQDTKNKGFMIFGLGKASRQLLSCNVQIQEDTISHLNQDDATKSDVSFIVHSISTKCFGELESFTSVAFGSVKFSPFLQTQSSSLMYEPLGPCHVYDIATGSGDGMLKLWKRNFQFCTEISEDLEDETWICVGTLKISSGPVNMIAIGSSWLTLAAWSPASFNSYGEGILIWSIGRVSERATFSLSDRISLSGSPISMHWHDLGNGGSFLGVLMQSELLIYSESRAFSKRLECFEPYKTRGKQTSVQHSWHLLASTALFPGASFFTWGPKGSLLVPFREHLLVYDQGKFPDTAIQVENQDLKFLRDSLRHQVWSLVSVGALLNSSLPLHHPVAMLYHLYTGNHQRARVCLQYLQQNLSLLALRFESRLPYNVLQICSSVQLLEIFLKESKEEKNERKAQGVFLSRSTGNAEDFEDYSASFSQMSLAGKDLNRAACHNSIENLEALNLEKLESLLLQYRDVLDLTDDQRVLILNVADVLVRMESEARTLENACLDQPGHRFWLAVHLTHSRQSRIHGKPARVEDLCLDSKAMAWALQSECKDSLLDLCLGSEISWPAMRALGAGFWLTDIPLLRSRIEKVARTQFAVDKTPKRCALLYLALQRKNVLIGLFKLSKDEKDRVLYEFLSRDFTAEKNQAAALKNAYVLLGKHQHDLAAGFFLLAGDLSSAVSACAKNLGDLQLALVVCRLIEGSNGPIAQRLIKDYALTKAHNEGDFWLASLFQGLLGQHTKAINELTGASLESSREDGETFSEAFVLNSVSEAFMDPEVGNFCLHVASKQNLQSGSNNAAMRSLCKWLCLRTAASLEQLGLPLEALEYLQSCMERFWTTLQPDHESVSEATLKHLSAFKNRLALKFQAHLVMVHPYWLIWSQTGSNNSSQMKISTSATDVSQRLLQSLDLLEYRFSVNSQYVAAEIMRYAYSNNMLYLQCLFTSGVSDGAQETRKILSLQCSKFLNYVVKNLRHELFKVIGLQNFTHCQPYFSEKSCRAREEKVHESSTEKLLLAMDLWLLLSQIGDAVERNVDVAVFALVLCSVAAWQKHDWSAVGCLAKLIISNDSSDCQSLFDVEAALGLLLAVITPTVTAKTGLSLGKLTEIEVCHVLGLAFWNTVLNWGKWHLRGSAAPHDGSAVHSVHLDLKSHALGNDLLKVLESIASTFRRKLAFFINTSVNSTQLCSWLLGNGTCGQASVSKCLEKSSSAILTGDMKTDNVKLVDNTPSSSKDCLMDEPWKQLLVPSSIRSAVELEGANLVESPGNFYGPECLQDFKNKVVEPVVKNIVAKVAVNHSEGLHIIQDKEKPVGIAMADGNGVGMSNATTCTIQYKAGEEFFRSSGDLIEAICVNLCCSDQVAVASSRKGLLFFDINTGKSFSSSESSIWSQAEWPQNGWANSESTPLPTFVSPGVGMRSKEGQNLGLGGATVGTGMLSNVAKESSFKGVGVGIPGYGGMGALGLGWQEWEDYEGVIDPLATIENVNTQAMDSHPLRPLFLVGSRNTHIYLWEFGKSTATATYGILPAANVPPPYALASITSVKFDHSGHRFATAAIDGTVCTWQLEVGGRSNVRPTDSCVCFDRHSSEVAFVGGSGSIIVATGASQNNFNLAFWDTLAPLRTSQAFVYCHEGGARCLEMFDQDVGGGSISSLIVTCGKAGDVSVHDFRYIASGKTKRAKNLTREHSPFLPDQPSRKQQNGDPNVDGTVWHISKAHTSSITCVTAVPGTPLFFTGSKDGDVKLWDVNRREPVKHWHRVHEKHMFLQHNARGFGAVLQESRGFGGIFQAAVTDIKPVSLGFLTCGGDGTLKLFRNCKADAI